MRLSRPVSEALALMCSVALIVVAPATGASGTKQSNLGLRWMAPVGDDPEMVLADRSGAIAIMRDGRVTALDREGTERWVTHVAADGETLYASVAAVGRGLVAIPVDERRVVALERRTGEERWRIDIDGAMETAVGAGGDGSSLVAATDRPGVLRVLDGGTGAERWSLQLPRWQTDGSSLPEMWFRTGVLVVQWVSDVGTSVLYALDASTGALEWEYEAPLLADTAAVTKRSVTIVQNLITPETVEAIVEIAAYPGRRETKTISASVSSLDLETGAVLWSRDIRSRGAFIPHLAATAGDGQVVIVSHLGTLRAFDELTGAPRWRVASKQKQFEADPRFVGPVVAMTVLGTRFVAFDAKTGAAVDSGGLGGLQLASTIQASAAAGNRLYLLTSGSRGEAEVQAYQAASKSR